MAIQGFPEVPVHGSYPMDSGRWEVINNKLTPKEAMRLLKRPDLEEVAPDELVRFNTHGKWPDFYPWTNKGYVIINQELPAVPLSLLMLLEIQTHGEVGLCDLIPGKTEAIFLADGAFLHIRAVK